MSLLKIQVVVIFEGLTLQTFLKKEEIWATMCPPANISSVVPLKMD